jgi:hypothetical protein
MNEIDAAIARIDKQIAALESQRAKLIEARDLAIGILSGTTNLTPPPAGNNKSNRSDVLEGLTEAIRAAIKSIGSDEFTFYDVLDRIERVNPQLRARIEAMPNGRASISGTLKRLADELGELEVIKRGKGSKASVYKAKPEAGMENQSLLENLEEPNQQAISAG